MVECITTEWSKNTTTLGEIAETKTFPCVVKVCEEIGNCDFNGNTEILSPFSSGDLIKIDSHDVIQKIRGRFVEWVHASGSYEEIIHHDISIPVTYEGFVQVLHKRGAHYVYHSIPDLMSGCPRYVITVDGIESLEIPKDAVLETIGWNAPHGIEPACFRFRSLEKKDIKIPSTNLGRFQVLRDDMKYTLEEVIERFPLPQIVQFTDQTSEQQMTIRLERVYTEHVMLGQYKSVHPDPVTAKFRCADILIPLRNSDLQQITVQYSLHRNSGEYGVFVAGNFRETNIVRQLLDKISKFESTEKPSIRFFERFDTPDPSPGVASSLDPSQGVASSLDPSQGVVSSGRPLPATPITDADATKEVDKGIKAKLRGLLKKPAKSKEKTTLPREPKSRSSWAFDIKDEDFENLEPKSRSSWAFDFKDEDYQKLDFEKLTDIRDNENYQTLEPSVYEKPFIVTGNRLDDTRDTENYHTLEPNLYEIPFIVPVNRLVVDDIEHNTDSQANDYTILESIDTEADC